jgi:hypothetical protein
METAKVDERLGDERAHWGICGMCNEEKTVNLESLSICVYADGSMDVLCTDCAAAVERGIERLGSRVAEGHPIAVRRYEPKTDRRAGRSLSPRKKKTPKDK